MIFNSTADVFAHVTRRYENLRTGRLDRGSLADFMVWAWHLHEHAKLDHSLSRDQRSELDRLFKSKDFQWLKSICNKAKHLRVKPDELDVTASATHSYAPGPSGRNDDPERLVVWFKEGGQKHHATELAERIYTGLAKALL
jgi:hypothetical protein